MKMIIAVSIACAGALASYIAPSPLEKNIDPASTASTATAGFMPQKDGQDVSAINLAENKTCLLKRGNNITALSRSLTPSVNCDDVWPQLSEAANWTENADGSILISDKSGKQILALGPSEGNSWQAFEPPSAPLTLTYIR
jgi:hypothetical protein